MKLGYPLAFATIFVTGGLAVGCGSEDATPAPREVVGDDTAALATLTASGAHLHSTIPLATKLHLNALADGCANSPGPNITVDGAAFFSGLGARIDLKNNAKGTHKALVDVGSVSVTLLPSSNITIPKQPVQGGVGGNPFIYIQILDDGGSDLSDPILLGRCNKGLSPVDLLFHLASDVDVDVDSDFCENHPGPQITLGGTAVIHGLTARFIFANQQLAKGPAHVNDDEIRTVDIALTLDDDLVIPKQPVLGGVGGNPIIGVQLTDGASPPSDLTDEVILGRCTQL